MKPLSMPEGMSSGALCHLRSLMYRFNNPLKVEAPLGGSMQAGGMLASGTTDESVEVDQYRLVSVVAVAERSLICALAVYPTSAVDQRHLNALVDILMAA